MKKIIAMLLVLPLVFSGCAVSEPPINTSLPAETTSSPDGSEVEFSGLNDPTLLRTVENDVYTNAVLALNNDNIFVENVRARYVSKEYLDNLAYNSQENIYFGYKLSELYEQFQGTKFVFTLGDDGRTTVKAFEAYDDTYDNVVRNVAIGSGVILLCVTVSVVTAGVGAPAAVSVVFAASAKSAAIFAASSGVLSGAATAITTGIQTNNLEETLKSTALAASDGFMWGAIGGAILGGASEAIALKGATLNGLKMSEAAVIQRESKYPLDVIKGFKTVEQYEICKKAGLVAKTVNGKVALVPKNMNLKLVDEFGRTNLQRMQQGLAAIDSTGKSYELHHIGQTMDSTLAMLTKAQHMQGGNNKIWHDLSKLSEIDRPTFAKIKKKTWKSFAELIQKGF